MTCSSNCGTKRLASTSYPLSRNFSFVAVAAFMSMVWGVGNPRRGRGRGTKASEGRVCGQTRTICRYIIYKQYLYAVGWQMEKCADGERENDKGKDKGNLRVELVPPIALFPDPRPRFFPSCYSTRRFFNIEECGIHRRRKHRSRSSQRDTSAFCSRYRPCVRGLAFFPFSEKKKKQML